MGIHRPSSKPRSKEFLVVFDFAHVNGLCWSSVSMFEVVVLCVSDMKSWCLLHWLSKNWPFFSEGFLLTETWFCKDWNPQKGQKADSFGFQGQPLLESSNKEGYVTPCISFNASPEKLLGMKLQLQLLAACDKRRCLEGFFEWLEWWLVVGIYQHGICFWGCTDSMIHDFLTCISPFEVPTNEFDLDFRIQRYRFADWIGSILMQLLWDLRIPQERSKRVQFLDTVDIGRRNQMMRYLDAFGDPTSSLLSCFSWKVIQFQECPYFSWLPVPHIYFIEMYTVWLYAGNAWKVSDLNRACFLKRSPVTTGGQFPHSARGWLSCSWKSMVESQIGVQICKPWCKTKLLCYSIFGRSWGACFFQAVSQLYPCIVDFHRK